MTTCTHARTHVRAHVQSNSTELRGNRTHQPYAHARAHAQVLAAGPYYHTFCLSVLTALVEAAEVGEGREGAMLEDLASFAQAAGQCEKVREAARGLVSAHAGRLNVCVVWIVGGGWKEHAKIRISRKL